MANQTTVYVVTMDGTTEEVTTIKEVKAILGDSKVTKAAIESGDYPMVTIQDLSEQDTVEESTEEMATCSYCNEDKPVEDLDTAGDKNICEACFDKLVDQSDTTEDSQEEDTALTNTQEEDTEDDTTEDSQEDDTIDEDEDEVEYPEVGEFKDEKAMKKYIKKLTDQQLEDWCNLEGAEWKPNDHESINRMRMAMAIKAIHFPDTKPKASKKKKSKYSDFTTEQLVQMALDNDVEVKDDKGDPRILRMYTIMALRNAGIIA